jgi:hypothetical protein
MALNQLTEEDIKLLSDFKQRRQHFDNYIKVADKERKLFTCPSCGFPTLTDRNNYYICEICNWEDEDQDDPDADEVRGGPNCGPNYDLSLTQSRIKIGKQLNEFSVRLAGSIIIDPDKFFDILNKHKQRMSIVSAKIKGNTIISDPIWDLWRKEKELIKIDLIERKKNE